MRHRRFRSVAAALIGLAAMLVAGCSASEAADESAATPTPTPTALQGAGETWSAFSAGWLEPLVPALTWGVGLAAALVVTARILVPVVRWSRVTVSSGNPLIRYGAWSVPALVVFSCASAMAVAFTDPGPRRGVLGWSAFGLAVASAVWCWWWLATRPRVAIRVTETGGAASVTKSAFLTHLVDDLGAAPPRGVESPSASDLNKLAEATSKVSENAFLASVVGIVEFVGNTAPWQVEVFELAERRALVTVRWNGRRVASESIGGGALESSDAKDVPAAIERMAAAVVATTMAERYADWTGLYGATRWQSVGLHLVGRGLKTDAAKKLMFERAVAADDKNRLALAALQNEQFGAVTDRDKMIEYLSILRSRADVLADAAGRHRSFSGTKETAGTSIPRRNHAAPTPPPRHPTPTTLLIRTLIIWAATLRNLIAAEEAAGAASCTRTDRDAEVSALYSLAILVRDACDGEPADDQLRTLMRARTAVSIRRLHESGVYGDKLRALAEGRRSSRAGIMARLLRRVKPSSAWEAAPMFVADWFAEAYGSEDPTIAHGLACYFAMKLNSDPGASVDADTTDAALKAAEEDFRRKIDIALRDPADAEWARRDPELHRVQARFWDRFHPDIPAGVRDVEPLKAHKDKLAKIGIRSASSLAAARPALGDYLGLSAAEFRRLRDVAALAARLEEISDERWRKRAPLLLQELISKDIDTIWLFDTAGADKLFEALGHAATGIARTPQSAAGQPAQGVSAAGMEPDAADVSQVYLTQSQAFDDFRTHVLRRPRADV